MCTTWTTCPQAVLIHRAGIFSSRAAVCIDTHDCSLVSVETPLVLVSTLSRGFVRESFIETREKRF